jgi:hypothetical protein
MTYARRERHVTIKSISHGGLTECYIKSCKGWYVNGIMLAVTEANCSLVKRHYSGRTIGLSFGQRSFFHFLSSTFLERPLVTDYHGLSYMLIL